MTLPTELTREDFSSRKAWGQIQIDFQRGRIVLVRKQETLTTPAHYSQHLPDFGEVRPNSNKENNPYVPRTTR
jgi:hypothetical protein